MHFPRPPEIRCCREFDRRASCISARRCVRAIAYWPAIRSKDKPMPESHMARYHQLGARHDRPAYATPNVPIRSGPSSGPSAADARRSKAPAQRWRSDEIRHEFPAALQASCPTYRSSPARRPAVEMKMQLRAAAASALLVGSSARAASRSANDRPNNVALPTCKKLRRSQRIAFEKTRFIGFAFPCEFE